MLRVAPLLLVVAGLAAAYALGLQRVISFAWLTEHWRGLRAVVEVHPVEAALAYMAIYTAAVACSLPGGSVLSITGGLLFGTILGAALTVVAATAGAALLYGATRSALRAWIARRAGPLLERLRPGLERDGFSYVLALRLMPIAPFWLVNLAAGLVGVRLRSFVAATFLGIVPGTVVFASVGAGLAGVLAQGGQADAAMLVRPSVVLPLAGLALLSLAPIALRRFRGGAKRHA